MLAAFSQQRLTVADLNRLTAMATLADRAALIVVDMQEDFCPPVCLIIRAYSSRVAADQVQNGTLPVANGREIAPIINKLLELPFKQKIATIDWHPRDHISFASQHPDKEAFASTHTINNPVAANKDDPEYQIISLWPDHCIQGTPGAEFIPEVNDSQFTQILRKGSDARFEALSGFGPPFRNPAVLTSKLSACLSENDIKRVYVCGLARDYCVRATAIDAADLGYETFMFEDATKAVDTSESGMQEATSKMQAHGVKLITSESLLSL
jgi:nicotinamidase-related amidase